MRNDCYICQGNPAHVCRNDASDCLCFAVDCKCGVCEAITAAVDARIGWHQSTVEEM